MARFFVALRPDTRAAARLAQLAADLAAQAGGRPMSACDVHLTLAFVGERPPEDAARLHALLDDLATHWPGLALARLGNFGRGLLWAAPGDAVPHWTQLLADEVRTRLRVAGIGCDERPLHLHATLVRGARRPLPGADARESLAASLPIELADCTLALGWSGAGAMPQRRYRWRAVVTRGSQDGHNLVP